MAVVPANQASVNNGGESKSARKKKAKAEAAASTSAAANGSAAVATAETGGDDGSLDGHADNDGASDHPILRELQKQIRNINKKLSATQKTDTILAENPGVSLDDLVAQRKINNDQKASILKKPQLQAQLAQIDEQIQQFRHLEADFRQQLQKQKQELKTQHEQELAKVKAETTTVAAPPTDSGELREKLLIFSQFLRTAASKRSVEEDALSPENMAFEGALLLVYGGDDKAVDAAIHIIEGSDLPVPGIDGELLPVKYSVVHQSSISHQPFANEEKNIGATEGSTAVDSDPTITHAGLTELSSSTQLNGDASHAAHDVTRAAGEDSSNLAGERWDPAASGTSNGALEEGYEIVARPSEEVDDAAVTGGTQGLSTNWADETAAHDAIATGNTAGDNWDRTATGESTSWAEEAAPVPALGNSGDDGFQQIPNRQRGRGGRGRGDGEGRGRGGRGGRGGHRGDGVDGGRGRGRGGYRGARGEGEDRGRGGRGRGRARGEGGPARGS